MSANFRPLFLLCAALAWGRGAAMAADQPPGGLNFSAQPTDAELFAARVLDEPLVPLDGEVRMNENQALAAALTAYADRATSDDCSSLSAFAESYPASRWTGPLLVHLGAEYYNYGYYSRALDAWERAWVLCQVVHSGPAKPEADRALGELVRMYSKIGRLSELSRLLDSTKGRNLDGPATQLIHEAQEALWLMQNKPAYSFGCGPSALDRILLRMDPAKAGNPYLLECKSSTNGFSLAQVADISAHLGMNYQMAFREPGAEVILPSVVNWKVGHYAALVERRNDHILAQDYTFRGTVWMTTRALDEEGSGYYLVPPGPLPKGWRSVSNAEGQLVWGKGRTGGRNTDGTGHPCIDKTCGGSSCNKCDPCTEGSAGMTTYTMHALLTSLTLEDTPVRFSSPFGPQVDFTATYNQLEANQPATFYYSNLGPKWDCNWLSYITDNPTTPGADVALYLDGGGTLRFSNFNPLTQSYSLEAMSQTLLVKLTSSSYELQYPDGSRREYSQSDGSAGSTRRIFLTQVIDPTGNAVQLNYDAQLRITNIVNAIGQPMTLYYTNVAYPFAITSVADPFGRTAQLLYDANGLLIQITDVLGLTSQYTYGANQFVTALTTPYGTTTFTTGSTNGGTYLTATDPLGGTEALEYSQDLPIPSSLPASEVPHGLSTFNLFMDARDSFYWDKKAFAEGAWDWSKAHIYHWLHQSPDGNDSARILESEKDPLESRIWYNYPGEYTNLGSPYYLDAAYSGASDQPSAVARVLDDGTTQLSTFGYNASGNLTNVTDPLGRNFTLVYGTNNLDLLEARMTHNGKNELLQSYTYNLQHQPLELTDAAGQTTAISYGARGLISSMTDPLNHTNTFIYDTNGFLVSVQGPLLGTNDTAIFTYDAFNRVQSSSDTEGYTVTYSYDVFDRPMLKTFPDGTTEQFVYDRLDLVAIKDRLGRWTTNTYNANRQLVAVTDPLGRITRYDWCKCGLLEAVIDPLGRATTWTYDIQSRPITKEYADGSMETYVYENSSGRLGIRTDASGQQMTTDYYADNNVKSIAYPNATNPTPTVTFTYDPDYNRVSTMQDGVGTTAYSYNPITSLPNLGAGELNSVSGPLPNSTVSYQYDQLGRIVNRAINGAGQNVTFDVLGRPSSATNLLGAFQYAYLNATAHLTASAYPNGQSTLYSYYGNSGDQRLEQIMNLKPNSSLLSGFGYAYNAVGQITSWTNQWDTLPLRVWNLNYDAADQLVGAVRTDGVNPVSTNAYTYDAAANRTAAAATGITNSSSFNDLNQLVSGNTAQTNEINYEWDAAHRLTAINNGSHRTEFVYDGFDRRARIIEKENGLVVADNHFLWCGNELCEERDATGAGVVRRFFPQGESLVGAGSTNLFYTRDHLGSIRETLDSSGTIRARYDYDPYGQQTVLIENPAPSFAYTGLFQHKPSGLDLAVYRGFVPGLGRWLNRDPIAEAGGLNLYDYVKNDPIRFIDPLGLCGEGGTESTKDAFRDDVLSVEGGARFAELPSALLEVLEHDHLLAGLSKTGKIGPVAVIGAAVSTGIAVKEDYENGAGGFLTAADAGSTLTSDLAVSAAPPLAIANLATGGAVGASVHNFGLIQSTVVDAALHTWNVNKQQAVKKMWTRNWLTSYVWRKGERLADWWYGDNPCP
jgi:RHS repeat-associated protein